MNKYYKCLLLLLFYITSCSNNSEQLIEPIDNISIDTTTINFKPLKLNIQPLIPTNCCFLDSLFIVSEQFTKVKKNFFKIYYKDTLILEFGNIGQGPTDFIIPFLVSKGKNEEKAINIVDDYKYLQVSVNSNCKENITEKPLPKDFFMVNNVLLYNDTAIVVTKTGEYQIQYYDRKKDSISNYNFYKIPKKYKDLSKFSLTMQIFLSTYSANEKNIVIAYKNYKMIDLVSINNMKLNRRLYFKDYDKNNFEINNNEIVYNEEKLTYFTYVIAYQDSFWSLCWNDSFKEVSEGNVNSIIYQIDYKGNILKLYKTNIPITSFTIHNDEIYAIGLDSSKNEMGIYKSLLK
ncbi:MAG: hypothetical protein MJ211_00885 [Bacteroidales bacterium]|nr:hypothetical protein [Bacteroidales bacterium]